MRVSPLALILSTTPATLLAQEHAAPAESGGLMSLQINLMFFGILRKSASPPIFKAVEDRERALEEAIAGAKRDREEAAKLLEEHRRQIEAARGEAQRFIAEGRQTAEKMRADLLEQT